MKNKKKIALLISLSILYSCTGAKDALVGKKRSDTSDEFLIKKKNPLVLPPDYEEMPVPVGKEDNRLNDQENINIKKLVIETRKNCEEGDIECNSSLEKSILEKITNKD